MLTIDDNAMQRFCMLVTVLTMVLEDDAFPSILVSIILLSPALHLIRMYLRMKQDFEQETFIFVFFLTLRNYL